MRFPKPTSSSSVIKTILSQPWIKITEDDGISLAAWGTIADPVHETSLPVCCAVSARAWASGNRVFPFMSLPGFLMNSHCRHDLRLLLARVSDIQTMDLGAYFSAASVRYKSVEHHLKWMTIKPGEIAWIPTGVTWLLLNNHLEWSVFIWVPFMSEIAFQKTPNKDPSNHYYLFEMSLECV